MMTIWGLSPLQTKGQILFHLKDDWVYLGATEVKFYLHKTRSDMICF